MPGRMRVMWRAAGLLALWAAAAGPAAAAPGVVSAGDIPSVVAVLQAAGHATAMKKDDEGAAYILVDEGEEEFSISFDDCEDDTATTGCNLLIFSAAWEADPAVDAEIANQFNQQSTLAHAFINEKGALNLTLSVTTKGGLPAANFAEIIAIWEASDKDLADLIDADDQPSSGVTVASLSVR